MNASVLTLSFYCVSVPDQQKEACGVSLLKILVGGFIKKGRLESRSTLEYCVKPSESINFYQN